MNGSSIIWLNSSMEFMTMMEKIGPGSIIKLSIREHCRERIIKDQVILGNDGSGSWIKNKVNCQ